MQRAECDLELLTVEATDHARLVLGEGAVPTMTMACLARLGGPRVLASVSEIINFADRLETRGAGSRN